VRQRPPQGVDRKSPCLLEGGEIAEAERSERLLSQRWGRDRADRGDDPLLRAADAHLHRPVDDERQRAIGVEPEVAGEVNHRVDEGRRRELVLGGLEGGDLSGLPEPADPRLVPEVDAVDGLDAWRASVRRLARWRACRGRYLDQLVRAVAEDLMEGRRV